MQFSRKFSILPNILGQQALMNHKIKRYCVKSVINIEDVSRYLKKSVKPLS